MIMLDFKELIDDIELAYIIFNEDGYIVYKNSKADSLLSFSERTDETNGLNIFENLFPDFNLDILLKESKIFKYTDKEQVNYYFKFKVYQKNIDKVNYYIFNIYDITEYKNEIVESEIYKTIFDCVASTIIVSNKEGIIEKVNPAFQELTGYTSEEAIGNNPSMLSSGYHSRRFYEEMWSTISKGEIWRGILRDKIKSGDLIWEKSVISPIKDASGNVVKYISIKENITKEVEQEEKLKEYAYQDALTGLYNRRKFVDYTKELLVYAKKNELNLFCVMIDLDNFKLVNDIYGHEAGNKVLIKVADILKENVRNKDIAARYGGEEFILILTDYSYEEALEKATKIKMDIGHAIVKTNQDTISITTSAGFVMYDNKTELSEWIESTDMALYKAKETGKNRVCEGRL